MPGMHKAVGSVSNRRNEGGREEGRLKGREGGREEERTEAREKRWVS